MHARAAGGDDHAIGQRRPAGEVNRDDILGLRVFKSFNDNLRQDIGCSRAPGGGRAARGKRRGVRRQVQRRIPPARGRFAPALTNMRSPAAHFKLAIRAEYLHCQHDLTFMLRILSVRELDAPRRPAPFVS